MTKGKPKREIASEYVRLRYEGVIGSVGTLNVPQVNLGAAFKLGDRVIVTVEKLAVQYERGSQHGKR